MSKPKTFFKHTSVEPFEGRLEHLAQWAQDLMEQYGPQARLYHSVETMYGGEYVRAEVSWQEQESPEDMKRRLARERAQRAHENEKTRKRELRELERLKNKYESAE